MEEGSNGIGIGKKGSKRDYGKEGLNNMKYPLKKPWRLTDVEAP
jgi:hypothetical protein